MLRDTINWIIKQALQLIFWVFVLSIRINDRTIYDHSHDILIDNAIVQSIDEKASELWYTFTSAVSTSFFQLYEEKKTETLQ